MESTGDLFKNILKARVYEVARRTPLEHAAQLSVECGRDIFMKREDLQPIFSFKIRGAYNAIAALSDAEKQKGVITASAGNHAQGVALSAAKLGVRAIIVMPTTTPDIKIKAVRNFGAEVVLAGDHYSDAYAEALSLQAQLGATMIHPFDDPMVIAGQGTIGKEILEDCRNAAAVFVPVGGGGLLAGIAVYLKTLRPDIKIIGVEPRDSDAMSRSVAADARVRLETVGIFADGVAVREVGQHTFAICRSLVDDFILVSSDEICSAIHDIYRETRGILEPAGALAWAGAKAAIKSGRVGQGPLVVINSGANMGFPRLNFVAERAMMGAGAESLFAVRLHEQKGALKHFCSTILPGKSITEFNYRTQTSSEAYILLGVSIKDQADHQQLCSRFQTGGYLYHDLTQNDLAKEHVRHMVGGRAPKALDEELYSFVFPERSGALLDFLSGLSDQWNISLFHYRSHHADYGRVLIAFELPAGERELFEAHLLRIAYPFKRETENPAYRLLLRHEL